MPEPMHAACRAIILHHLSSSFIIFHHPPSSSHRSDDSRNSGSQRARAGETHRDMRPTTIVGLSHCPCCSADTRRIPHSSDGGSAGLRLHTNGSTIAAVSHDMVDERRHDMPGRRSRESRFHVHNEERPAWDSMGHADGDLRSVPTEPDDQTGQHHRGQKEQKAITAPIP